MAIKLALANMKGGIGKTTSSLNIADVLMKKGYTVLLVDADPQMNSTKVYGANFGDGIPTLYDIFFSDFDASVCIQHTSYGDIIPCDDALTEADTQVKVSPKMYRYIKKAIVAIESMYDFIIFDTPPRTGVILGNVLMASDYVIVPITCDAFGIQGMNTFHETIQEYQEDNEKLSILGLLKIKYKGKQILTQDLEENALPFFAQKMNTKIFDSPIRESVKCQEAQALNMRLSEYSPKSTTYEDYVALTEEILKGVL